MSDKTCNLGFNVRKQLSLLVNVSGGILWLKNKHKSKTYKILRNQKKNENVGQY